MDKHQDNIANPVKDWFVSALQGFSRYMALQCSIAQAIDRRDERIIGDLVTASYGLSQTLYFPWSQPSDLEVFSSCKESIPVDLFKEVHDLALRSWKAFSENEEALKNWLNEVGQQIATMSLSAPLDGRTSSHRLGFNKTGSTASLPSHFVSSYDSPKPLGKQVDQQW